MKLTLAFFVIFLFSSSIYVHAQTLTITGKVFDLKGVILPGTSVNLKGDTTYHVKADLDGEYVFNLKPTGSDTLIFSYIGFENKEVIVRNQQTTINVILTESKRDETEGVVVAFGVIKGRASPVDIPNSYKGDNDVEIPNSYNADLDISIDIPYVSSKVITDSVFIKKVK